MSSAAVASGLCRRCSKPLVKNHGDIECLACGTLEVPGLTPVEAAAEVEAAEGRRAPRRAGPHAGPPWTAQERETWKTWQEGDPVPGDDGNERDERPAEQELATLDTAKLAALLVKSLRGLALEMARLQTRQDAARGEAKKLIGIVGLCGGVVPAEVAAMFGVKTKAPASGSRQSVLGSRRDPTDSRNEWRCPHCGHKTVSRWARRHLDQEHPTAGVG